MMASVHGRVRASPMTFLLGLSVAMAQCMVAASSATWTVGDAAGWGFGNYDEWTQGKIFRVGDVLFFRYSSGEHSVLVVSKADYDSCTTTSPIATYNHGNTNITLNTTGKQYYICGVEGHCGGGMKLAINSVDAAAPTPSPSPTPARSPTPSAAAPTPTPAPSSMHTVPAPTPVSSPSRTPSSSPPSSSPSPSPLPAAIPTSASFAPSSSSSLPSSKHSTAPSVLGAGLVVAYGSILLGSLLVNLT